MADDDKQKLIWTPDGYVEPPAAPQYPSWLELYPWELFTLFLSWFNSDETAQAPEVTIREPAPTVETPAPDAAPVETAELDTPAPAPSVSHTQDMAAPSDQNMRVNPNEPDGFSWTSAGDLYGFDGSALDKIQAEGLKDISDADMADPNTDFGKSWLSAAKVLYADMNDGALWLGSNQELADWAEARVSWYNNNVGSLGLHYSNRSDAGNAALVFLTEMNNATDWTWYDFGGGAGRMVADVTNIPTLIASVFTFGGAAAGVTAAKEAAKAGVKASVRSMLKTGIKTQLAEAAVTSAADSKMRQDMDNRIQDNHGYNKSEFSYTQLAMDTGLGVAAGLGLSALSGVAGVGYKYIRDADVRTNINGAFARGWDTAGNGVTRAWNGISAPVRNTAFGRQFAAFGTNESGSVSAWDVATLGTHRLFRSNTIWAKHPPRSIKHSTTINDFAHHMGHGWRKAVDKLYAMDAATFAKDKDTVLDALEATRKKLVDALDDAKKTRAYVADKDVFIPKAAQKGKLPHGHAETVKDYLDQLKTEIKALRTTDHSTFISEHKASIEWIMQHGAANLHEFAFRDLLYMETIPQGKVAKPGGNISEFNNRTSRLRTHSLRLNLTYGIDPSTMRRQVLAANAEKAGDPGQETSAIWKDMYEFAESVQKPEQGSDINLVKNANTIATAYKEMGKLHTLAFWRLGAKRAHQADSLGSATDIMPYIARALGPLDDSGAMVTLKSTYWDPVAKKEVEVPLAVEVPLLKNERDQSFMQELWDTYVKNMGGQDAAEPAPNWERRFSLGHVNETFDFQRDVGSVFLAKEPAGAGTARREIGQKIQADFMPELMSGFFQDSPGDRISSGYRSYIGRVQSPNFWRGVWGYAGGKQLDYPTFNASSGEGRISKPMSWKISFRQPVENETWRQKWWRRAQWLPVMAWRYSGSDLPAAALRLVKQKDSGIGRYAGYRSVRLGAHAIGGALTATALMAEEGSIADYATIWHPVNYVFPVGSALAYETSGAAVTATTALLPYVNAQGWGMARGDFSTFGFDGSSPDSSGPSNTQTAQTQTAPTNAREEQWLRTWAAWKADQSGGKDFLQLEGGFFGGLSEADEQYIEDTVAEAANLYRRAKQSGQPMPFILQDVLPQSQDQDGVMTLWLAAQEEVNQQIRLDNIEDSLNNAYNRARHGNIDADERRDYSGAEHFDTISGWLMADDNYAKGEGPHGTHPWNDNETGFMTHYERLIREAGREHERVQEAIDGFVALNGYSSSDQLTDIEKEAVRLMAAGPVILEGSIFRDLSDVNDPDVIALRNDALRRAAAIIDQRRAAEGQRLRYNAAVAGYISDLDDVDNANELSSLYIEAAKILAVPDPRTGAVHSVDVLKSNAGKPIRDDAVEVLLSDPSSPFYVDDVEERRRLRENGEARSGGGDDPTQAAGNALSDFFAFATDTDNDGEGANLKEFTNNSFLSGVFNWVDNSWNGRNGAVGQSTLGWIIAAAAGLPAALLLKRFLGLSSVPVIGTLFFVGLLFFGKKAAHAAMTGESGSGNNAEDTEGQGEGGHLPVQTKGVNIRLQPHDGRLPQMITIEGDFDGDENTIETLNLFDLDRDENYVAQVVSADGVSFVSPEMFSDDKLQGILEFIPEEARNNRVARATASNDGIIEYTFLPHEANDPSSGVQPIASQLRIRGHNFTIPMQVLNEDIDNETLDQMEFDRLS